MKQTAAMSLGILGLNEDFVQRNEIMNILKNHHKNNKNLKISNLYLFVININNL